MKLEEIQIRETSVNDFADIMEVKKQLSVMIKKRNWWLIF